MITLKELREICDKASAGPWEHHNWDVMNRPHVVAPKLYDGKSTCNGHFDVPASYDDAEFIAASRTAVPLLIEEVEMLRDALEKIATCKDDLHPVLNTLGNIADKALAESKKRLP